MRALRGLALGIGLALLLGSCSFGRSDNAKLVGYFTDVGDLVEDATVQVADVEVGRVDTIDLVLRDGRMMAKVVMSVDRSERIPAGDIEALVRQTSLLGEQFIQLVPTSTGPPYVGDATATIPLERTARRVDIESFLSDLSAFIGGGGLEDLNRFTHAQALILEDRGRRFGETLEELATFTGVLAGRRVDVGAAIDRLASASGTLASNQATLDSFLDSLEDANALLAEQGDRLGVLFRGLHRFGRVNARFLARHEDAINRQFKALRPILSTLAGAQGVLRRDITQLRTFLELFPKSLGGGPGGAGAGDYVQAEAVLCETLSECHTNGEKGDVPGEGS
jgi:phospholipid/cholesterol/gamma-HCH transport system substrate-binding protein